MNEVVRRQILVATSAFDVPLDAATPSRRRVRAACEAAKLLRNRVLRERARAVARIDALRQQQIYDDDDDDEQDNDESGGDADGGAAVRGGAARPEYAYLSELAVAEQRVVPLLLAHGLQCSDELLPQLLKLLVALLQPPLRFAADEMAQRDAHARLARRCAHDEFVAMLLQCVAPVTARRARGEALQRDDAVLLELVLTLLVHLLVGSDEGVAACLTGALVRNHTIDFLIVVLHQNYRRLHADTAATAQGEAEAATQREAEAAVALTEADAQAEVQMVLSDGDDDKSDDDDDGDADVMLRMERQYAERVRALLEGEEQLTKWNTLIVAALAGALACVPRRELAEMQVAGSADATGSDASATTATMRAQLRACARERADWRRIARSRNGAMCSTALIVRGERASAATTAMEATGNDAAVALGTVSTLLSARHSSDALAAVRALDLRKRGRFVRGMYESTAPRSELDLHTGKLLARQSDQLLRLGLEPLNAMLLPHMQRVVDEVDRATSEYVQLRRERARGVAGAAGEDVDGMGADAVAALAATAAQQVLDAALYERVATVLHYMRVCIASLAALRAGAATVATLSSTDAVAQQQQQQRWRSVSCLVDVAHVQLGYALLRACMRSRDMRRRVGVDVPVTYLAELLLTVQMLLTQEHGGLANTTELALAAHALASVTLYREDNIRVLFELLSCECVGRGMPVTRAQACVQLVYVVFDLMDRCSYDGTLLLPSRKRTRHGVVREAAAATDGDAHAAPTQKGGDDGNEDDKDDVRSMASVAMSASTQTEREVAVASYVRRLASPHGGVALLYGALERWRVHDADVNFALVHLLEALVQHGCAGVLYNVPFLLVMHDVLAHAMHTHRPLYLLCDRVVYDFFNPPHTQLADARLAARLGAAPRGALSHRGFEVALRCSRALFSLGATDYALLEEKAIPHLVEHTTMPLPHEAATDDENANEDKDDDDTRQHLDNECGATHHALDDVQDDDAHSAHSAQPPPSPLPPVIDDA